MSNMMIPSEDGKSKQSLCNSNASSNSTSPSPFISIYKHLNNMGASLRCPLCLNTLRGTPILLPCIHAFCHECILEHFNSSPLKSRKNESNSQKIQKLCPVCKIPATKRSIQPSPHLRDLVLGYKSTLKSFGIVPVVYDEAANINMTQIAPPSQSNSVDINDKAFCQISKKEMKEHLQVSRAWMMELQKCDSAQDKEIDWLKNHQKTVVSVDENALMNHSRSLDSNLKSESSTLSTNNDDNQKLNEQKRSMLDTQSNSNDNGNVMNLNNNSTIMNQSSSVKQDKSFKKKENLTKSSQLENHSSLSSKGNAKQPPKEKPKHDSQFDIPNNNNQNSMSNSTVQLISDQMNCTNINNEKNIQSMIITETIIDPNKTTSHQNMNVSQGEVHIHNPSDKSNKDIKLCTENKNKSNDDSSASHVNIKNQTGGEEGIKIEDKRTESKYFQPGIIVSVKPRTWPGSNKPGGIARVMKVYPELNSYDVMYILGGREKKVSGEFVTSIEDDQGNNSRPRKRSREMKNTKHIVKCASHEGKSIPATKRRKSDEKENKVSKCNTNKKKSNIKSVKGKSRTKSDAKDIDDRNSAVTNKENESIPVKSDKSDKKSLKEIQKLTEEIYADKIDTAMKSGVVYILMSNVTDYAISLVDVLTMEMKRKGVTLKVLKDFNATKKPTLCITSALPENPTMSATRTLKTMCCALTCTPILNPLWLTSSLEEKNLVHPKENMYIQNLPSRTASIQKGGKLQERSELGVSKFMCHKKKLLEDFHVIICGPWTCGAKKSDIKLLLKECGALIHSTMKSIPKPLQDTKIIMLCDDSENAVSSTLYKAAEKILNGKEKDSLLIVGGSWLFDCISCSSLLDGKDYIPKGKKSKALWTMQYQN